MNMKIKEKKRKIIKIDENRNREEKRRIWIKWIKIRLKTERRKEKGIDKGREKTKTKERKIE